MSSKVGRVTLNRVLVGLRGLREVDRTYLPPALPHPAQGPSWAFRDLLCRRTQFLAHTKRRVPKSWSSGTAASLAHRTDPASES